MRAIEKRSNPFATSQARPRVQEEAPSRSTGEMDVRINEFKSFVSRLTEEDVRAAFDKMIGAGSEHLVFELRRKNGTASPLLIKIDYRSTEEKIEDALDAGQTIQWTAKRARADLEAEKSTREAKLGLLRKYFGYDSVPNTRLFVTNLTFTRELVEEACERLDEREIELEVDATDIPKSFSYPVLAAVQRRVELSKNRVSINVPRFEILIKADNTDLYSKLHWFTCGKQRDDVPSDLRIAAITKISPRLAQMRVLAEDDPSFKAALRVTVERMVDFINETGVPLDTMGVDNLLLSKKNGKWQLDLLDPLLDEETNIIYLKRFIAEVKATNQADGETADGALTALNAVRGVNALAEIAGTEKRVVVESLEDISAATWIKIYKYFSEA